ncbi:MAG: BON domain-containing protein [Chloroflexi bacterium]|jgi:osmotically-inducible protein OsmY|nr:BON domain-containing protein [Chloroflexota bacterium]
MGDMYGDRSRGVDRGEELAPEYEPTSRDAEDLKADVEAALDLDPAIESDRITVDIDGGTVILRGTVDSDLEREAAENDALEVPGVTDVRNDLSVGEWKGVRTGPQPPLGR